MLSIREEKGRASNLVDTTILTKLKTEEVQFLVFPPTQATGNRTREKVLSFDELTGKIQLTQVCERNLLPISWETITKFDQMVTTDVEQLLFCAQNIRFIDIIQKPMLWQLFPKAQSFDQFWKFIFEKILDRYVIEVSIPSIAFPVDTSYVVISRETARFVNDIHDHKEGIMSSDELLRRSEFYEEVGGTSIIKETCASPLSIPPPRASLYTQRTTATNDWKWKVIHAHSSNGGYVAVAVSMMVTKMLRHFDQDERQTDASRLWDTNGPV